VNAYAVSGYSTVAQLVEVRLRLDAVELDDPAALLVEGPDDKRLFLPFARHPALLVPCAGRTHVLEAMTEMTVADRKRVVALTDCDFEVTRGELKAGSGLIITEGTDVEADMITLGLLERIVQHLIPGELREPGDLVQVATETVARALKLATPLGRARMAAQPLGVPLEAEEFTFGKHQLSSGEPDVDKIIRTIFSRVKEVITLDEFRELYDATPDDPIICKGNDLLVASAFILRRHYRANNKVKSEMLDLMLRTGMADSTVFERWSVVKRIREWERVMGRRVLIGTAL
jgi:hypothetical protein